MTSFNRLPVGFLALLIAITLLLASGNVAGGNAEPQFVGAAGGIFYFYDNTQNVTWSEAKVYCEEFHLKLARIKTKAQLNLFNWLGNEEYFWTAGRTAFGYSKFVWDHEELETPDDNELGDLQEDLNRVCLAYKGGKLSSQTCEKGHFVLCEDTVSV